MPIIDLQSRARELGRIRIGVQVPTKNGKTRPEKLDRFRITSASRTLIERVAELYGGEAVEWDNHGSPQYEVITTSTRLPVLVPPQPISQWYELWSGGGCQRRCDGVTEMLKDKPCLCGPDPSERDCKPTTRLNVILRDVKGIGVWRLESHGYYSAIELPDVAAFLARAGGYINAWLSLEQRTAIRDGQTRRWMVPTLEVDITPAQLLAGGAALGQIEPTPPPAQSIAVPAALPVVAAPTTGKAQMTDDEFDMARQQMTDAMSMEQLRETWRGFAKHFTMPELLRDVFTTRGEELQAEEIKTEFKAKTETNTAAVDVLWQQVLVTAPEEWTTQVIEAHFTQVTGVDPGKATAADVQRYIDTTAETPVDGAA